MAVAARPLLLVSGIGDGLGAAIAEAFAASGHDVLGIARSEAAVASVAARVAAHGGGYSHVVCDITDPVAVTRALQPHLDRIAVLVHNAQALAIQPLAETDATAFERAWRVACLGAFIAAQAVIPGMVQRAGGTIILSGATASRRGGPKFAAFASAKFALRGLAQSMAREYAPSGIHVAHVVIDGLIEGAKTDARFGAAGTPRMMPDAVARTYLDLATQPPSAWTHELDLRPFN
jgi:NAD(P)-dependent dehydrogenase (short-subunit alcohol dehydrogenase family)